MVSHYFELASRYNELVSRYYVLASRYNKVVSRYYELVSRYYELVSRSNELVSRYFEDCFFLLFFLNVLIGFRKLALKKKIFLFFFFMYFYDLNQGPPGAGPSWTIRPSFYLT